MARFGLVVDHLGAFDLAVIIEMRGTSCHAGMKLAGILSRQVEDPPKQDPPIKLDYATPPQNEAASKALTVPAILARRVTWGVAFGILVSSLSLICFADDDMSGGMCLMVSPAALLFTYASASAGGWNLDIPRTSRTNLAIRAAFLFGFLMPTLTLITGGLLDKFQVNEVIGKAVSTCTLVCLAISPFASVVVLVRWSLSADKLSKQDEEL